MLGTHFDLKKYMLSIETIILHGHLVFKCVYFVKRSTILIYIPFFSIIFLYKKYGLGRRFYPISRKHIQHLVIQMGWIGTLISGILVERSLPGTRQRFGVDSRAKWHPAAAPF